jgi:RNA polymerase sigma-70 factor, ECF subfamily
MTMDPEDRLAGLVRAHHRHVLAYARRRLGDWQAAEDLAAETFAIAWRRLGDVPAEPLPWLYRVAYGLLRNEYRRSARRRAVETRAVDAADGARAEGGPRPDDPGVRVAEADRVVRALSALSEADRDLLMLIGWEELSVAQAARVLAVPAPVVSVRLHRARRRLAARLAELDFDPPGTVVRGAVRTRGRTPDPTATELRRV